MLNSRKTSLSRIRQARQPRIETLESRNLMAVLPYGALPLDTAEFMLGKIAVTPVFLESNGQLDASTENWTPSLIQSTLQTVEAGVDWWVDLLAAQQSVHTLEFVIDTTYATTPVPTRYEPISRVSNDYALWSQEFLATVGFNQTGSIDQDMRAFNNAQRQKVGADWAFTVFVINSNNDGDGQFPPGGSFTRAFGFAGGLFLVSPSTRPASTFAHEIGHMFWGKDEYAGGASYAERRGYYGTQNSNAADNPAPGFVQQPSIMATGTVMQTAFDNYLSPASTLAMVGWQDSDQDGIFDVLDVPLELAGTGYYDTTVAAYKFRGSAKVGVLPNLNTEGLKNDITLNRVSSIQYRVDGGTWTTVSQPNAYEVELDLSIPVAQPGQSIEIRAVDAKTGITSNIFQGRFARADAVASPGINGFVWIDANKNNLRDVDEFGDASWTVEVLSSNGQPLNLRRTAEPDNFNDGVLATGAIAGVNITAIGADADGRAGVFVDSITSTGTKSFRGYSRAAQSWLSAWNSSSRRMQIDFATPTSVVEIDAIGTTADSFGRIDAYDATGKLLDRFTTASLSSGQVANMRVESSANNIAYVIIGAHANSSIRLDNLRFGPTTTVITQAKGQFSVSNLPAGNYRVKVTPTSNSYAPVSTGGNQLQAAVTTGAITSDIDFAFVSNTSIFQNPLNRFDVNGSQSVSALDVLLIVNDINQFGARDLAAAGYAAPPYLDVSGDGFSSALDALLVINVINSGSAGESSVPVNQLQPSSVQPSSVQPSSVQPSSVQSDGQPANPEKRMAADIRYAPGVSPSGESGLATVRAEGERQLVASPTSQLLHGDSLYSAVAAVELPRRTFPEETSFAYPQADRVEDLALLQLAAELEDNSLRRAASLGPSVRR